MLVDLSLPLEEDTQLFPGLPGFDVERSVSGETGAVTRRFASSTHQGTHVDAPAHYVDGPTVDELALNLWDGPARVVDLRAYCGEAITAEVLRTEAPEIGAGDRVLLSTGDVDERFGDDGFFDEAATLTESGARWLVDRDISLLANDFLTESLEDASRPVHTTLLGNEIPLVEYLCNVERVVDADAIEFACFPLNVPGFEASPVRAVARVDE